MPRRIRPRLGNLNERESGGEFLPTFPNYVIGFVCYLLRFDLEREKRRIRGQQKEMCKFEWDDAGNRKTKNKRERRKKKVRKICICTFLWTFLSLLVHVSKTRIYHRRLARSRVYQSDWRDGRRGSDDKCLLGFEHSGEQKKQKRTEKRRQTT